MAEVEDVVLFVEAVRPLSECWGRVEPTLLPVPGLPEVGPQEDQEELDEQED